MSEQKGKPKLLTVLLKAPEPEKVRIDSAWYIPYDLDLNSLRTSRGAPYRDPAALRKRLKREGAIEVPSGYVPSPPIEYVNGKRKETSDHSS